MKKEPATTTRIIIHKEDRSRSDEAKTRGTLTLTLILTLNPNRNHPRRIPNPESDQEGVSQGNLIRVPLKDSSPSRLAALHILAI